MRTEEDQKPVVQCCIAWQKIPIVERKQRQNETTSSSEILGIRGHPVLHIFPTIEFVILFCFIIFLVFGNTKRRSNTHVIYLHTRTLF